MRDQEGYASPSAAGVARLLAGAGIHVRGQFPQGMGLRYKPRQQETGLNALAEAPVVREQ